ncbi:MAG: chromate transporter [Clostridia bacterium]|nr:chromate transporter [Clostridia bacterium]
MILRLMLVFMQVGAFSVGGGYAAMPLIQSLTVDTHAWLTMQEFTDLVTIAEMTPGPIAINAATFVGLRVAGIPGSLAATLGCILPSLVIVTLLSWLYARYRSGAAMQTVLGTLRPAVVALIASAALSIIQVACITMEGTFSWPGAVLMAAAFIVLRWKKCSPIPVMAACGLYGVVLHALGWM